MLQGAAGDIKSFQKIFKEFIRSTNDYHVNVAFCSTGSSWFPIKAALVQGRYFIAKDASEKPFEFGVFKAEPVEMEKYIESIINLNPGDEILAINGKPVAQIIEALIDENIGGNRSPTSYAMASKMLFKRSGTVAKTFNLTLLPAGAENPVVYTLPWLRIAEWIGEQPLCTTQLLTDDMSLFDGRKESKKLKVGMSKLLEQDFSIKEVHPLLFQNDEEKFTDKRDKGKLPPLGEVLWESAYTGLYSYLYQNQEGRKIGYLYIPSFEPINSEAVVEELIEAVKFLETESEALIVDITDNPGGSAMYAYAILSTLTAKPLICPKQRETLIQEDLLGYIAIRQIHQLIGGRKR